MGRRRAGRGTPATPATTALERAGVPHRLHAYPHDPRTVSGGGSYGLEAADHLADALGIGRDQVLKTLVAEVDGELVVAVVPVTGSLDLKALARALGGKRAALAEPSAAERTTGYVTGGISPLGQRTRLRTVVDETAPAHDLVLVSAGRRGADVALAPADLVRLTGAVLAPVGRPG